MIGTSSDDVFCSSSSHTFSSDFWKHFIIDHPLDSELSSLRDEGLQTDLAPLHSVGLSPLLSPSLASGIGSLRYVYEAWKTGNLSRAILRDISSTESCNTFFSTPPSYSLFMSPRSRLASLWKVTLVSSSAPVSDVSTGLSAPPSSSTSSFGLRHARSKSPASLKTPLGTFGVASASYYWSRVAAAVGRLAQYLTGYSCTTWHMLVADDYLLECGGPYYRRGLVLFFVLCASLGVPLAWHKTAGGNTLIWVGFELLLRSRSIGISERRAEWFARWTDKIASSATVHMASFEEGLGASCSSQLLSEDWPNTSRVILALHGALEHERPFLGPLYKFLTLHPRDSVRRVPSYFAFILRYLSSEILKKRHYLCGARYTTAECIPRVDAQASSTRTGVGGWYPARNSKGELDPWCSDWFSLEISKEDFPWIFEKGDKPSLVISTLEALAILISLKLRFGDGPDPDDTKVLIVPSITDNRGNGAVLNKLMTTCFPSSALLMEMGSYMKARGMRAIVEWAPREFNKEADQLANGITDSFDPDRRLHVSSRTLNWNILPTAIQAGRDAEQAFRDMKERYGLPDRCKKQRKRKVETRLKITDPW